MSNLLRKGAEWLQQQRHTHCTESILVGGVSLLGTVAEIKEEVDQGGVKITSVFYHFIVRSSDLTTYNINPVRGLSISWGGNDYEVISKPSSDRDNDPTGLDVILRAVKR